MAIKLSPHFTYEELTNTSHRELGNSPPKDVLQRLAVLAGGLLEQSRSLVGPLHIQNGYRSPAVNAAVYFPDPPNTSSAHLTGDAADVIPVAMPIRLAFEKIAKSEILFDQIILEGIKDLSRFWIHIGQCKPNRSEPRRQVLMHGPWCAGFQTYDASRLPANLEAF